MDPFLERIGNGQCVPVAEPFLADLADDRTTAVGPPTRRATRSVGPTATAEED
ncbi:hypothetical protein GA0070617_2136 [Micromonospora yangpuensis]|uniref:Uncharacterized protein n=1 Tax=Micromonospora yangpuensis TaxID=683228 RepID=A0A1C6UEV0_9ACTN|nr:hypothetical protein GA0070617_2136 [Micromonospora yangpuensis]